MPHDEDSATVQTSPSRVPRDGLLQSKNSQGPTGNLFKQVAERVEQTVKPEMRRTYDAIVVAGMKLMWGESKTHQMMLDYLQLVKQNPAELVRIVAHGLMKLMSVIFRESKLTKEQFMAPSAPAALVLMTQVLEYLQKRMGIPIDKTIIDQLTKAVSQGLFELYGVTPEQIEQAIQQRQGPGGGAQPPAGPGPAQAMGGT